MKRDRWIGFVILPLLIIAIGITIRLYANYQLNKNTQSQNGLAVSTITAKATAPEEELILPGNVTAWHEATIFARTNGYVKKWLVDIGDRVKKDQLLAIIEIPEVEAQLRQADADLKTAIANYQLAETTAVRWKNLLKTNSVSKQETDEKVSSAQALKATMHSARARRDSLRDLVSFKRVTAPFDGIISNRITDIGNLISEGSNTTIQPLFNIVQADRLRVYVKVPQLYATRITKDMTVDLIFKEHPGKVFEAKLRETAKAIDPTTRTLLAEFVIDNAQYELLSGGYTQVHLTMPSQPNSVLLPVNTLLFRKEGLQVATVDPKNVVLLKSVRIARDFGTSVEISANITPGEKIILNPPDSIRTGDLVSSSKS